MTILTDDMIREMQKSSAKDQDAGIKRVGKHNFPSGQKKS
jgi:hypothetical protein